MARIAGCGDLHIDQRAPANRKDDYVTSQFEKFTWMVRKAMDEHCRLFCMPGDIFNHPRVSLEVVQMYIKFLKEVRDFPFCVIDFVAVYGQHDLYFHAMSSIPKTPLNLMAAAGVVSIAGPEPLHFPEGDGTGIQVYGASWECDIPTPKKYDKFTDVLLIHTMMVGEKKLWEGQEKFTQGRTFLRDHPYDIVFAGDNHQQFHYSSPSGKSLVNAGSVMRSRIDQIHHEPAMYVYDTVARTLDRHPIPIHPYQDVIDIEKSEQVKERDEKIEAFVESLDGEYDREGVNFRENLSRFIKTNDIPKPVIEIINQSMEATYA